MPEIGETLRETRMRRRIDMTEVEAATKIRAKYLRALENEEWDLLPGPTFVKTFLRTYAEYLDLDPRLLVEEYRQRYERPSTQDLTPFGPGMGARPARRRRRRQRRPIGPFLVVRPRRGRCCSARCTCSASCGATRRRASRPPDRDRDGDADRDRDGRRRRRRSPRRKKKKARADARDAAADRDRPRLRVRRGRHRQAGASTAATSRRARRTKTFRSQRFRANFGNGGDPHERRAASATPAAEHRQAGRLRDAAGQEAPKRLSESRARGALRAVSVRAGIVVTGTEVLGGLIRDANGPWLSEQLRAHGVELAHTSWSATGPRTCVARAGLLRATWTW